MKYFINSTIIFGLILLLATGCEEDFLDRNDPGDLTWSSLYNTEDDFMAALAGCYQAIQSPATTNIFLGEITSDNVYISRYQPSGSLPDIDKLVMSAQNGELSGYWSANYTTIQRVNLLLDRLADVNILTENMRNSILAEAKFLRAYSYFNLVRVFGGVPLYDQRVNMDEIYDVPRSSEDETLNLVISDLNEAKNIDSYRSSDQLAQSGGKATSTAAKTLLAKAYLWKKDFTNAETTLSELANSDMDLVELSELYDPDNPFNNEIIFSINYERTDGFSSPFVNNMTPYNSPEGSVYPNIPSRTGSGYGMIEPYVAAKFSPDDKRTELIDTLIFENLGIVDTNIYCRKYVDTLTTFNGLSGSNTIILRYADVLLMYAEALNENGKTDQAYQYINEVRNRAELDDLPEGFSKAQMFQALADERQREFLLEGDRWFDLKFRGIDFLKSEMNDYIPNAYLEQNRSIVVRDIHMLFPIPESQMEIKPILEPNPGY